MNLQALATAGNYILDRLKERNTWLSIGTFLTGIGVVVKPDQWQIIMGVGMGLPGLITALMPPRIQEKNIVPAAPEAPTTPIAQSLANKVATGQTDTTGASK